MFLLVLVWGVVVLCYVTPYHVMLHTGVTTLRLYSNILYTPLHTYMSFCTLCTLYTLAYNSIRQSTHAYVNN